MDSVGVDRIINLRFEVFRGWNISIWGVVVLTPPPGWVGTRVMGVTDLPGAFGLYGLCCRF